MRSARDADVLVVGAGIAGLTAAARLIRIGVRVDVIERAPELRATGAGIMLHPNALWHLADVQPELEALGARIARQLTIDWDGANFSVDWGSVWPGGALPVAIHRRRLAEAMLRALPVGMVRWATEAVSLVQEPDAVSVAFADGAERRYTLVLGADGINSSIRAAVAADASPRYLDYTFWRTTAAARDPLDFPDWRVRRSRSGFFGAMPIGLGRMHVFLQAPSSGLEAKREQDAASRVAAVAAGMGADVASVVESLHDPEPWHVQPSLGLTVSRWARHRVALAGDAAHALSPATTQGGGLAIEDAVVLADEVRRHGLDPRALEAYEMRRRARVERFVHLSRLHVALISSLQGRAAARRPPVRGGAKTDPAAWFRRLYSPLMEAA